MPDALRAVGGSGRVIDQTGAAGQVLTSNGAVSFPSWSAAGSAFNLPGVALTGATIALAFGQTNDVSNSGSSMTLNLPAIGTNNGKILGIYNGDASASGTITPAGTDAWQPGWGTNSANVISPGATIFLLADTTLGTTGQWTVLGSSDTIVSAPGQSATLAGGTPSTGNVTGGSAVVAGGNGNGSGLGGGVIIVGGTGGGTNAAGGAISFTGGAGGATNAAGGACTAGGGAGTGTGNGGACTYAGGNSGTGATGTGGACVLGGGNASSTNGGGGACTVAGGTATGTGTGGALNLFGGTSGGAGGTAGSVTIRAGSPTGGTVGAVNICAGSDKLGFYGAIAVVQATRAGQITDNTGGSATTTFAAITAGVTYAQADMTACKNGLASIAAQYNKIETMLHNLGLSA